MLEPGPIHRAEVEARIETFALAGLVLVGADAGEFQAALSEALAETHLFEWVDVWRTTDPTCAVLCVGSLRLKSSRAVDLKAVLGEMWSACFPDPAASAAVFFVEGNELVMRFYARESAEWDARTVTGRLRIPLETGRQGP